MKPKPHRNKAVVASRESGKTLKEVAEEFGITIERVRQIVLRDSCNQVPKPTRTVKEPKRWMTTKRRKPPASEADKRHLMAVKSLPCCICGAPPPSQAHHVICGRYGSRKPGHRQTIPLCQEHHQIGPEAIHNGKSSWVAKHGDDRDYIEQTLRLIYG